MVKVSKLLCRTLLNDTKSLATLIKSKPSTKFLCVCRRDKALNLDCVMVDRRPCLVRRSGLDPVLWKRNQFAFSIYFKIFLCYCTAKKWGEPVPPPGPPVSTPLQCRQNSRKVLFLGKLGSNEICLSANGTRTKSVCRQIGLERNLFVGKLGLNETCLSANWGFAPHQQFSLSLP